jgi:hypothetical protein
MKKVAIGLLAATGIALAIPAHAQGVWFGAGPVGVDFGTGPYTYDYAPYWGGSYAPAYTYVPGYSYTYGPDYDLSYTYGPGYGYSYAPEYTYSTKVGVPSYRYSSYAYEPRQSSSRSVVRVRNSHQIASRRLAHRPETISGQAYRAQASVATGTQRPTTRSPYCDMAKSQRNPVSWNAYYHCLNR